MAELNQGLGAFKFAWRKPTNLLGTFLKNGLPPKRITEGFLSIKDFFSICFPKSINKNPSAKQKKCLRKEALLHYKLITNQTFNLSRNEFLKKYYFGRWHCL